MTTRSLLDAVIDPGIRNPNYFEGRLLTADALRDDQRAQRERQRLLGRAIGSGVVEGLTVEAPPVTPGTLRRTVTITKGYAINTEGDTLWLQEDLIADVVPPIAVPEAPTSLFARCKNGETPEPTVPVGVGLYVLVVYPASAYRERAAKSGLGSEGRIIGCGDRYAVDGVRFRLERLDPQNISGAGAALKTELTTLLNQTGDAAKRSLLRNLAAHLCFGTPELAQFAVDPFAREDGVSALLRHGAIDDLRGLKRITDCDVPLALILWDTTGIAFVDMWAVRRRPVAPARSTEWPLAVGERTVIDAEARFLQFQSHIDALVDAAPLAPIIKARDHFRWLPPAGILRAHAASNKGLSATTFFQDITVRYPRPPRFDAQDGPVFVEGARVAALLRDAQMYPSIDTTSKEAVVLYRMRENRAAIDAMAPSMPVIAVVFASGHLPYYAAPRFDVAQWNYSNYSSAFLGPGSP